MLQQTYSWFPTGHVRVNFNTPDYAGTARDTETLMEVCQSHATKLATLYKQPVAWRVRNGWYGSFVEVGGTAQPEDKVEPERMLDEVVDDCLSSLADEVIGTGYMEPGNELLTLHREMFRNIVWDICVRYAVEMGRKEPD